MTRSPLFWLAAGAVGYWALQHFTGVGNTGKAARSAS
jgi:hypothetical protein